MVWLETPTNPTLKVIDIRKVVSLVKSVDKNIIVVVDNTFLSPIFQRPLELGADIVVHSATKYLNGHSDVVMGVLVTNVEELRDQLVYLQNAIGAVPSPSDCYLLVRGLKTLYLRMKQHESNAMKIATFLQSNPNVEKVFYPGLSSHPQHLIAKSQQFGFGGMISFRIKGDIESAILFTKSTKIFVLAESLGGVESLIELPAIMTHGSIHPETRRKLGITDNLIRISVGIEDSDDLINDLMQAFEILNKNL